MTMTTKTKLDLVATAKITGGTVVTSALSKNEKLAIQAAMPLMKKLGFKDDRNGSFSYDFPAGVHLTVTPNLDASAYGTAIGVNDVSIMADSYDRAPVKKSKLAKYVSVVHDLDNLYIQLFDVDTL
jgi:hypothetical protein